MNGAPLDFDTLPLAGVKIVDFSTLLPGPLATYMLAECGAEVVKVERLGVGDEMRTYGPVTEDGNSIRFLLLNGGKRSRALDLKSPDGITTARHLVAEADVLVEQFRPGVMERLGLGYEALSKCNPGLIYCSITGYGQTGPDSQKAGHDLNYAAATGLLSLVTGPDGAPVLPATTFADIGGGSYPAVMNIVLALLKRARTGRGEHLDIAMADNMFPFIYSAVSGGLTGQSPRPNCELLTGASPRYALYRTADDRWLAVAALEQRFWDNLCDAIGLEPQWRGTSDPEATRAAVAARVAAKSAADWEALLSGADVCTEVVRDVVEAVSRPQAQARALFGRVVSLEGEGAPVRAMHLPIVASLRKRETHSVAPSVGSHSASDSATRPEALERLSVPDEIRDRSGDV